MRRPGRLSGRRQWKKSWRKSSGREISWIKSNPDGRSGKNGKSENEVDMYSQLWDTTLVGLQAGFPANRATLPAVL